MVDIKEGPKIFVGTDRFRYITCEQARENVENQSEETKEFIEKFKKKWEGTA